MGTTDVPALLATVWRVESPSVVARLARLVGDIDTAEELAKDTFVAALQRWRRAKRTLAAANVRFELPAPTERRARLDAVREVIYLAFNEGYAATSGERWIRNELCAEALRLGRMLAHLTPTDPETLGLLALLEMQASRFAARVGPRGKPVLLMDQHRTRWDQLLIRRGLALIDRIDQLHGNAGPYALQAAIAACHARARTAADTDWPRLAALDDGLVQINPSPVVELNRAVAAGWAFGPEAGLHLVLPLFEIAAMRNYHLLAAVTGDLLCRAGRHDEARPYFLRAAELTSNGQDRRQMLQRAAQCLTRHEH